MKLSKYTDKKTELYGKVVTVSYLVGRTLKSVTGKWSGDPNGKYMKIREQSIFYKEITDIKLKEVKEKSN